MIKKALSYMLCLCVLISFMPGTEMVLARAESYSEATLHVGLLEGLGIIRKDDKIPASYSEDITRLDAVKYVLRFANVEAGDNSAQSPFTDINDAAVTTAASVGIISTVYNEFRPYDFATYHEAIAMIVNAMGYKEILKPNLPYPDNYMELARTLKIECASLKGNNDGNMTYTGLFELMYEGLNSYIIEEKFISQKGSEYAFSANTTYLESRFDVLKTRGIVEAVPEATFTGDKAEEGTVIIDSIRYSTDNTAVGALLGYKTELFYSEKDAVKAERKLIYIHKKYNDETLISSNDFEYATKNGSALTLYYRSGNRNKKVTLSSDVVVVYNGMPYKTTQVYTEWFNIKYGSLSLVNNDGTEGYDIAFINNYDTLVVSASDAEEEIIFGKYQTMGTIDLENVDAYRILDAQGNVMELSEITENNVISVLKSRDKSIYTLIVSNEKISGKIVSKYDEDGKTYLEVDGEEYLFNADTNNTKILVNEKCTLLLDAFGAIADITYANVASDRIGYFVGMGRKQGVNNDWNQIAILEANGEEPTIFPIGEKIKIDGKSYKNSQIIPGTPLIGEDGKFIRCAVKFELDKDGNIAVIDTPKLGDTENARETMHQNYEYKEGTGLYAKGGKLGGKGYVTSNTIRVIEPQDPEDIMAYYTFDSHAEDKHYKVDLYIDGSVSPVIAVALFKDMLSSNDTGDVGSHAPLCVYDKTVYTKNSDDEFLRTLTLVCDGQVYTVPVPEDKENIIPPDLKRGDVVRYELDARGELKGFRKVFDYASKAIASPFVLPNGETFTVNTDGESSHNYRIVAGYVYYQEGDYYKIDRSMTGDQDKIEVAMALNWKRSYIYEVDDSGVTSRVATASDIKPYINVGGNATYGLCHFSFEQVQSILFIKNNDYEAPSTGDYYAMFCQGAGNTTGSFKRYANSGATITLPGNTFENYGYKFMGWTDGIDAYQTGETYTMPKADIVFYPVWEQGYVFEFVSGADDATGNAPDTITELSGAEITIPENPFSCIGKKFVGWKGSDNVNYQPGDTIHVENESITFTAQWVDAITISFAPGVGSGTAPAAIAGIAGETKNLPENTFTAPVTQVGSYSFGGWTDGVETYQAGSSYTMPATNKTLTAVWAFVPPTGVQELHISIDQFAMVYSQTPDTHVTVGTDWNSTNNHFLGRQILLKADLSAYKGHLTKAILKLEGGNATVNINAYKLDENWNAATVTYNDLATVIGRLKEGTPDAFEQKTDTSNGHITIDLVDLIDENGILNVMIELTGEPGIWDCLYGPGVVGVKLNLEC